MINCRYKVLKKSLAAPPARRGHPAWLIGKETQMVSTTPLSSEPIATYVLIVFATYVEPLIAVSTQFCTAGLSLLHIHNFGPRFLSEVSSVSDE